MGGEDVTLCIFYKAVHSVQSLVSVMSGTTSVSKAGVFSIMKAASIIFFLYVPHFCRVINVTFSVSINKSKF